MKTRYDKGFVVLAGAGPGDPELITLKLARRLAESEVVLVDRLVSPEICQQFAPKADIIQVGKQCRRGKSTPQKTINELLVYHAKAGRFVVRLKGGDTGIFSNLLDELATLKDEAILFEIIPGVTAASGVAAAAGMPLTARGLSQGVHFVTCYKQTVMTEEQWVFYAKTNDTLVFYMSGEVINHVQEKLLRFGKASSTPVLLAEQATTPQQRFRLASLETCARQWQINDILSPAMLVVGDVAALHKVFFAGANISDPIQWFDDACAFIGSSHLSVNSKSPDQKLKLVTA